MTASQTFSPDWISPPGDTIIDILNDRGIERADFTEHVGLAEEEARDLLTGRMAITLDVARSLSETIGASTEFWIARDLQYRKSVERLQTTYQDWLNRLPLGDMVDFGWVDSPTEFDYEVAECLRFFDVPSVPAWQASYGEVSAAFRSSEAYESSAESLSAWLRQGERVAARVDCADWDRSKFENSLSDIRSLTKTKEPTRFLPKLQTLCASGGVAIAIVRTPEDCHTSGAARFLSPDKAAIILSFRHLSDDHFWFTFFHEAAHLIRHGDHGLFIDEDSTLQSDASTRIDDVEKEANHFAELTLIPPEHQSEFRDLPANHKKVVRFAIKIGIAPGIVVGQMQHQGLIPYNYLNRLKRRYEWVSDRPHPVTRERT